MRNPFRSEADAFRFTLVAVGLGVAVALAGVLGGSWVALGVFLAFLVYLAISFAPVGMGIRVAGFGNSWWRRN